MAAIIEKSLTPDVVKQRITDSYSQHHYDVVEAEMRRKCRSGAAYKAGIAFWTAKLDLYNTPPAIRDMIMADSDIQEKFMVPGTAFNGVVRTYIFKLELDEKEYDIIFEKNCPKYKTDEIPDWYIVHHVTKKILIGMNQVALCGGGAQSNRVLNQM